MDNPQVYEQGRKLCDSLSLVHRREGGREGLVR